MIRDEKEYRDALAQIADQKRRLSDRRRALGEMGLTQGEAKLVIDPIRSFQLQLEEEVASYELSQGNG